MYNRKRAKLPDNITLDWILSKVTEYDIYAKYIGQFKVGMIYNSPFRKDKNPSFGIYYSKRTKQLLFKDHGTGECGNVVKFVSLYTGKTDYNDILHDIVEKLNITNNTQLASSKHYIPSQETVIGVVRQDFTDVDINYWAQFNISLDTLKKFNVSSIKYYLCNGIVKGIYKRENPMYAYKVYNNFKIYRPLGDKFTKWRNNLTEYDIQGYEQLPQKGDILFITKSMKDIMCLYEMGLPAISPSSESTFIPNDVLEQLKKRFKRIIILFDRDIAGVRQSRKLSLKMGLESMLMHKKLNGKDVSDTIKVNDFKTVKDWLFKELKKHEKSNSNKLKNLKVKNATKVEIDGITFRSKLEAYTYLKLKEAGIKVDYEMHRYTLLPAFIYSDEKVRAITYLPDFVGEGFVIECKGFATDSWPNREKLFKYYLSKHEPNTKFYLVRNLKQVNELIKKLTDKNTNYDKQL